jgi:SHS2 domain-containing protein
MMDPVPPGFEYFDVEADVGVTARGPTLESAFAQTALGFFALTVSLPAVQEREVREVRAHGATLETLLVNWLNECLYVHDVEAFVAGRVEFIGFEPRPGAGGEPLRLHSLLHGEEIDPARHEPGTVVKAATLHGVSVRPIDGGYETRVILDV